MFGSVIDWAGSPDRGEYHLTTFRKQVASVATVANDFVDYTYFAGNPPANFYASAPLVSALVENSRGILLPGRDQFLKSLTVMSSAASATTISSQNQRLLLADYLLYYPFIDTDAVGEQQDMVASATLPRYSAGVQMMAVSQSAASTVGTFTVSYTNQDGVPGRTSQTTYTKVVAGGGTIVSSSNNATTGSLTCNADTIGEGIVPETGRGGGYGSLFREQSRRPIFADMAACLSGSSTMAARLSGLADLAAVLHGSSTMEGRPITDITKLLQRRRDEETIAWLLVA